MGSISVKYDFIPSMGELSNNQNSPIVKPVNSISQSYTSKVANILTTQPLVCQGMPGKYLLQYSSYSDPFMYKPTTSVLELYLHLAAKPSDCQYHPPPHPLLNSSLDLTLAAAQKGNSLSSRGVGRGDQGLGPVSLLIKL